MSLNSIALWNRLLKAAESGIFLISGPNVIESRDHALKIAHHVADVQQRLDIPIIYKASFDKVYSESFTFFSFNRLTIAPSRQTELVPRVFEDLVAFHSL